MSQNEKSGADVIKLPDRSTSPKVDETKGPPYFLLNPFGGEIYKVDARYPTQYPLIRQCKFMVYWTGGQPGVSTLIYLIDSKNYVTGPLIWSGPNVAAGQIGSVQYAIPSNFDPTDDWNTTPSPPYPSKPGMYAVLIRNSANTVYAYSHDFTIVWDF